ncbi:MAG TPA: hypothetical protein VN541_00615, partial [Tepidisphaeraceae bacterium]|nr:hypothetical protein [Tepidisphaeraceae bacterium]
ALASRDPLLPQSAIVDANCHAGCPDRRAQSNVVGKSQVSTTFQKLSDNAQKGGRCLPFLLPGSQAAPHSAEVK